MLVITEAKVDFANGSISIEIAANNGVSHTFDTTLADLEKAIIDLAKVRLMAVIQSEKGVKLTEPVIKEFLAQSKGIRNILVPQDEGALKAG